MRWRAAWKKSIPFGGTHRRPRAAEAVNLALDPTLAFNRVDSSPTSLINRLASPTGALIAGWIPRFWQLERVLGSRLSGPFASSGRRVGSDRARPLAPLGARANSSLPPSANPPRPKPVVKQPTGRRGGGQPWTAPYRRSSAAGRSGASSESHRPTHCRPRRHALPAKPGRRIRRRPASVGGLARIAGSSRNTRATPGPPPPAATRPPPHPGRCQGRMWSGRG